MGGEILSIKCSRCGEIMEYLGDEDDGSPIYKCNRCDEIFVGERNSYEQMVGWATLLREAH